MFIGWKMLHTQNESLTIGMSGDDLLDGTAVRPK